MKEIEELREQRDVIESELLEKISDARSNPRVREIILDLFKFFPECNGFVLMASYKGDNGERAVYGFEEIEESVNEEMWFDEIGESLSTINAWLSENRSSIEWTPELEKLFEELADIYPYPEEKEFDWDGMRLDSKNEILLLSNGDYV